MTEKQKRMVQESFGKLEPVIEQAGEMFYNRLFEVDPSLRQLFKVSTKEQARRLM